MLFCAICTPLQSCCTVGTTNGTSQTVHAGEMYDPGKGADIPRSCSPVTGHGWREALGRLRHSIIMFAFEFVPMCGIWAAALGLRDATFRGCCRIKRRFTQPNKRLAAVRLRKSAEVAPSPLACTEPDVRGNRGGMRARPQAWTNYICRPCQGWSSYNWFSAPLYGVLS